MRTVVAVLKILFFMWLAVVALVLVGGLLIWGGFGQVVPLLLFVMLAAGWTFYAFLRYRQTRQDELFQVIAAAVAADLPLGPAIRAYLQDRPHEGSGGAWDVLLLVLLFPAFWLWLQRHVLDRRAAAVADLLDEGFSLTDALRAVPGVASREVKIAAAVGQTTGRLAECLRRADRERLGGAWLELVPRLLYPLLLLIFIAGVTGFLVGAVMPRMAMILSDFGEPMPDVTARVVDMAEYVHDYSAIIGLAIPIGALLMAILIASPGARWHLPILGRLYRWEVQGLILRMLGALVEVGRPAPEALALLESAADVPGVAQRGLATARKAVQRGEPLATALRRGRLLPSTMVPLVQTAERTHTLPWALAELGELLAGKAVRLARRTVQVLAPAMVVAIGGLVLFIVLGMFMPLINLLSRLTQ